MKTTLARHPMIITLTSLVGGLIAAVLLTIAFGKTAADYMNGGVMTAFWILIALIPIVTFVLSVLFPAPRISADRLLVNTAERAASIPLTAGILLFSAYNLYSGIAMLVKPVTPDGKLGGYALSCSVCLLLAGLFSLAAVGYPLVAAITGKRHPVVSCLTGIAFALSLLFYALYLYFDVTAPKNATLKLILSLAILFCAVFLLADVRRILGRKVPHFYTACIHAAGALACAVSLGGILHMIIGGETLLGWIPPYVLLLVLFLYIYIRQLTGALITENDTFEGTPSKKEEIA